MKPASSPLFRASRLSFAAWLASSAAAFGCSEQSVNVELQSLQASGDVTYVCREANFGPGVPLAECNPRNVRENGTHDLIALVTQTSTGQVAVVNVPWDPQDQDDGEGVVDIDPSTPGYGFLNVGARPGDLVTTPGGQASFVGTSEVGNPGLFALPTSCLGPPNPGQTRRDITSWPACSLPRAPGEIRLVVDPVAADGTIFRSCDRSVGAQPESRPDPNRECSADLTQEAIAPGRRKLLVSLPDSGSIAVIDAQWLLDRDPGSFEPCAIEIEYPLEVSLPAGPVEQALPPDLNDSCVSLAPELPPPPPSVRARPSGLALADGVLYVGDDLAPVIHRLDVSQPCAATELPPLLPRSFEQPSRVVTTSRVAVSPLTPSGKRFVYAIDELDQPLASVMAFDVSPGATQRTPLLRPGSTFLPFEAPDRLELSGSARDVQFFERDRPYVDPVTGTARIGELCDPSPNAGPPGSEYQPEPGFDTGARALELRGVFASVLQSNGQVAVIDVEDFDAPCRRPAATNPSSTEDFRGCANDSPEIPRFVDPGGDLTVTDEVSCRVVEPHRARSVSLAITSSEIGLGAPSLGAFPQLSLPDTALQSEVVDRPKLLAVDFPGPAGEPSTPAQVYVGTTLYAREREGETTPGVGGQLVIDPARSEQYSVALPFNEPRAYSRDLMLLEYEGIVSRFASGFLQPAADAAPPSDPSPRSFRIVDDAVGYCDRGVHDIELMREIGQDRFGLSGAALEAFADAHPDTVVLTGDFVEEDDSYWSSVSECSRDSCLNVFGEFDADELLGTREFRVVDAQQQQLVVQPTSVPSGSSVDEYWNVARCCFPSGTPYAIRASRNWVLSGRDAGVRHDIVAQRQTTDSGASVINCVRDCNPRKRYFESRVFEITSSGCGAATQAACGVGPPLPPPPPATTPSPDPCIVDGPLPNGVPLDSPAAACIVSTATARFAVYRGQSPTRRGTIFSWPVDGEFRGLSFNLENVSSAVSPQTIVSVPEMGWLSVVDASSLGLGQISLEELRILTPTVN